MADETETLRMQVERLIARVAAKDAEFAKERDVLKAEIRRLKLEVKEARRAA